MNIVTLGTSQKGGIDSVIQGYIDDGLYNNCNHYRLATHAGKSKINDLWIFFKSFIYFVYLCFKLNNIIVHSHMSYKGSFWRKYTFFRVNKLFKNKTIIHLHGSEFKVFFESRNAFTKSMIIKLIQFCDEFVVLSDSWAEYITSISGRTTKVINNYVDITPQPVVRSKNKILFLGAFIQRKGIYDLIKAFSHLDDDYELHLCGSGEDEKVNQLATSLEVIDRITLHGWVDFNTKNQLLSECTVMILPSYNEGLPMVLIEAMACEIPIITTPVGGIPEVIIDGKTGYLTPAGDVDKIVNKLREVLSASEENEYICKNAKDLYLDKFNSKIILPIWIATYSDLDAF